MAKKGIRVIKMKNIKRRLNNKQKQDGNLLPNNNKRFKKNEES